jgi:PadR family transcriptional regulator PadR
MCTSFKLAILTLVSGFLTPRKKRSLLSETFRLSPGILVGKGETNQMKGTYLGEFEELVLLAVGILSDDAYGLAVADELEKQTGRVMMMSSVHKALVRLEDKGFVKSHMGGATEMRGGRDKRLYTLTRAGVKVLRQSKEIRNAMWNQVPKMILDGNA